MMRLHLRQLAIFLMALALAIVAGLLGAPWPLVWMQPPLAMLLAMLWRTPRWWWLLHLLLLPAVFLAMQADLPPWLYLLAALLLFAISRNALTERVPLFLTSQAALDALAARLPPAARLIDLGCGTGRLLEGLSRRRPDLILHGVESAWLPWLWARWSASCWLAAEPHAGNAQ